MSNRFLTAACSVALAAASLGASIAADPATADLSRRLSVGEVHRYALDIQSSMTISSPSVPEQVRRQSVEQSLDLSVTVKELDPAAGATLEVRYDSLRFEFDAAEGKQTFNSADPANPDEKSDAAPALRPVVGTVLTVKVGPDGRVTDVTGGASLERPDFWGQVAGQFGQREIVAAFIEPMLNTYHGAGEAAVGETWTHTNTLEESALGAFRIVTNHTLESVRGADATVTLSGKIKTVAPKAEEGAAQEGAAPPLEIKDSANTGSYVWDTAAGILKRLEQRQSVSMTTAMQGLAMNVENSTTLRLVRKDAAAPPPAPPAKPAS